MYESTNKTYVLPENFSFPDENTDTKYSHVYGKCPKNIVLKVNNGELISVPVNTSSPTPSKTVEAKLYKRTYNSAKTAIKNTPMAYVCCTLPVFKDGATGDFVFNTEEFYEGNLSSIKFDEKTKTYSVTSSIDGGIQLELKDIVINQNDDAENGFIPGFAQLKANININNFTDAHNNTAMGEIGSYYLSFIVDGKEIETTEDFFIYGEEGVYPKPNISVTYLPGKD